MAKPRPEPAATQAEEAVNTALQAEREAVEAVAECEGQAAKILAEARLRARRINERTDMRISRLHLRCARAVASKVESLLRQDSRSRHATPPQLDSEVLGVAIERLARQLTEGD